MQHDEFMQRLRDLTGLSEAQTVTAMRAVLVTLADRIGPKEANDTASHLPKGVKEACRPEIVNAGSFDAAEFLRRVAQRAGISRAEARERARAVFIVLQEAVPDGELEDWQYDLSTDYVDLAARPAETGGPPRTTGPDSPARGDVVVGAEEFLRRVAQRTGMADEGRPRRATDAVLETFGEQIATGEAEDLALQLPEPAAEPLRRPPEHDAHPVPADEFVRRVAEREGEIEVLAREHARAVLTTVREAVTVDEWKDTLSELPKAYDALLES